VQGCGSLEETPDLLDTEDRGQTVCGCSAHQGQDMPVALEDMLGEKPDATVPDTHGVGGEIIDMFSVQEVLLKFRFRDALGGCVVTLREQANLTDRGLLSPFTLAAALKCRNHLPAQWGHERSPLLR
jgi:hypothetical protein